MLLRHSRGFGLGDLEETAKVVGHRPLGSSWFRPEKVKATSPFACQLQATCKDLSRVDPASTAKEIMQVTCLNIQATTRQRPRICAIAGHTK